MKTLPETPASATQEIVAQSPSPEHARPAPRICQVTLRIGTQSETFVRAHQEHLPFPVDCIGIEAWDKPELHTPEGRLFPRGPLSGFLRKVSHERVREALNQSFRRKLTAHLKRGRYDCVLAEYGTTGAVVAASCTSAGVPLVVHFHGFDAHVHSVVEEMREKYTSLFRTSAAIVVVSETMRDALAALGCAEDKLHIVPCGVDVEKFRPAPTHSTGLEKPFQFFFVGRFVNKKAPVHLLLAFKECLRTADARLVMAGDGPLLEVAREVATALGISDKVSFPGGVAHDRVQQFLQESNAYVQHSIQAASGDCEGSPVAVVEAAAAGLPVISTRHTGIRQSVVEGDTGFLVDEGAVEEMGQKMASLVRDRGLARRLGAAGREHARRHYSLEVTTSALAVVLRQAAAGRVGGS